MQDDNNSKPGPGRPPVPSQEVKAKKRERVAQVVEWLVQGLPARAIVKEAMKKFTCSERTVWNDLHTARVKVLPTWYEWGDQRVQAAELLAKLDEVFGLAMAGKQLGNALRALHQMAELRGMTATQQIARERDTFRQQLEAIRAEHARTHAGRGMPLEQFNLARAVYGLPPQTEEEYAEYCAAQERLGDPAATSN